MADCPNGDVRDLLPDLLHDRLAPDVRRDTEAHLSSCAECRGELALLGAMRSTLRRAAAVDAAAIAAAIVPYRAPVRRSWGGGWRAAAAVLLLVGGTSVVVLQSRDHTGPVVRDTLTSLATRPADTATSVAPVAPDAPIERADRRDVTPAAHELALGSSVASDLDDRELSTLLSNLQTLDVVPSAEVENPIPVSPLQPAGTN